MYCLLTMLLQFSMKLLCVSTRKSVSAVVHAPAPVVVGMRYSRGVSRVSEGRRCFSYTLRRAVLCACVIRGEGEGEVVWKGRNESEGVARNLPWSLSLSPTSSQAFCRLSTISWYSLQMLSECNKMTDYKFGRSTSSTYVLQRAFNTWLVDTSP